MLTLSTEDKTRKESKWEVFGLAALAVMVFISSAVQMQMHKHNGLDYEEMYTKHGYKELTIPQNASKK